MDGPECKITETGHGVAVHGVLIWIHVGCDTLTPTSNEHEIRSHYALNGFYSITVTVPHGPTHTWTSIVDQLCQIVYNIRELYRNMGQNIYIGGCSMGGYYAYVVACKENMAKCALVCPVLNPYAQKEYMGGHYYKETKQLLFFAEDATLKEMTLFVHTHEPISVLIVTGTRDNIAPAQICFPEKEYVTLVDQSHDMYKPLSRELICMLDTYLAPNTIRGNDGIQRKRKADDTALYENHKHESYQ